jgi:putative PIN family toxin of toxin-antitoxin system
VILRAISLNVPAFVLDTDVIVAGLRSREGASRQLFHAALDRAFDLLLSVPLILEYEAVLRRPEHLHACGLNDRQVERVLDDLAAVARPVKFGFRWRPKLRDPNDDMVLETAVNGGADAIVTFNRRDFRISDIDQICAVILPGEALKRLRRQNP